MIVDGRNKYYVNNIFVVIILVELLSCNQHSFELQTFWAWILSEQTGLILSNQTGFYENPGTDQSHYSILFALCSKEMYDFRYAGVTTSAGLLMLVLIRKSTH